MDDSTFTMPGRYPLASLHPSHPQYASKAKVSKVSTIQDRVDDTLTHQKGAARTSSPPHATVIREGTTNSLPAPHRITSSFGLSPHTLPPTILDRPTTSEATSNATEQLIIARTMPSKTPPPTLFNLVLHSSPSLPLQQLVLSQCPYFPQQTSSPFPQLQYPVACFFYDHLSNPHTLAGVLRLQKEPRVRKARIPGSGKVDAGGYGCEVEGVMYYILSDDEYVRLSEHLGPGYRTTVVDIEITEQGMRRSRNMMGLTFVYTGEQEPWRQHMILPGGLVHDNAPLLTRERTTKTKSRDTSVKVLADLQDLHVQVWDDPQTQPLRLSTGHRHSPSDPFNFQDIDEVLRKLEHEQRESRDRANQNCEYEKPQCQGNTKIKGKEEARHRCSVEYVSQPRQARSLSDRPQERDHVRTKSVVNKPLPPLPRKETVTDTKEGGKETVLDVDEDSEKIEHRLAALRVLEGLDEQGMGNGFQDCERMLRSFYDD